MGHALFGNPFYFKNKVKRMKTTEKSGHLIKDPALSSELAELAMEFEGMEDPFSLREEGEAGSEEELLRVLDSALRLIKDLRGKKPGKNGKKKQVLMQKIERLEKLAGRVASLLERVKKRLEGFQQELDRLSQSDSLTGR